MSSSLEDTLAIKRANVQVAGYLQLSMMGLGIILSGVAGGWTAALTTGAGEYLISLMVCNVGYVVLSLCVSEMAGIVPFSGGSYGYVRCTLTPFVGFLVGICDIIQSTFMAAVFVDAISRALSMACTSTHPDDYLPSLPGWYALIYAILLGTNFVGGSTLWAMVVAWTIVTLTCMIFYGFMSMGELDYEKWSTSADYPAFNGTPYQFFALLVYPCVNYVGVDLLTLFADETKESTKTMPKAMMTSIIVTVTMATWITIASLSQSPGIVMLEGENGSATVFPMRFGFQNVFGASANVGNLIMAPQTFSSAIAFFCASGRIMRSMSLSRLLPKFVQEDYTSILASYFKGMRPMTVEDSSVQSGASGTNAHMLRQLGKTPSVALTISALIGYSVLLLMWHFAPQSDAVFQVVIVGACFVYVAMFMCYIIFAYRYSSMKRSFVNHLGVPSAVFGIVYFSMVCISVLCIRGNFFVLLVFVPIMIFAFIYYFSVAESRQFFSQEEQEKFMKAYILNANNGKKKKPMSPGVRLMNAMLNMVGMEGMENSRSLSRNSPRSPRLTTGVVNNRNSLNKSSNQNSFTSAAGSEGGFVSNDNGPTASTHVLKNNAISPAEYSSNSASHKSLTKNADDTLVKVDDVEEEARD